MYIGSVSSFVKFGDQTTKKVHDVQKVCLETTLCIYVRFIEFYELFLDENYVVGHKLLYEHGGL